LLYLCQRVHTDRFYNGFVSHFQLQDWLTKQMRDNPNNIGAIPEGLITDIDTEFGGSTIFKEVWDTLHLPDVDDDDDDVDMARSTLRVLAFQEPLFSLH
jgi:hypothetical protein